MGPTDYQRRSPEYAQYYYARAKEDNQRAYDQQQRAELAKWAKTSGYLGNEGQQGLPSANPALQAQPGTGIYAEGFDPDRREMMLRNQQMLMSENDAMQAQGMSQMGGMQDSRNTGVNQIDLAKWKKDNLPEKPTNPYANVYTGADNRRYGTNIITGQTEELPGGANVRQNAPAEVNINNPEDTFDNEMSLRKELTGRQDVKDARKAMLAYDQMQSMLDQPSAVSNLAVGTMFMKMLDPGSVVRESELALAMNTRGVLDGYMQLAEKWSTGQQLTDGQLSEFRQVTRALMDSVADRYNTTVGDYRTTAESFGYDADRIGKFYEFKSGPTPEVDKVSAYDAAQGGDTNAWRNDTAEVERRFNALNLGGK